MTLSARSSLGAAAAAVAGALRADKITAVHTGGAWATLYSAGAYHWSAFTRRRDRYVHPRARFYVEFPRGPLAIGGEHSSRPISGSTPHGRIVMLSATNPCRDRLAAFYHWVDRQSFTVAAWIAIRNRVNLPTLRRWSLGEGMAERFE